MSGALPSFLLNTGIYKFNIIFGENQRYVLFHVTDLIQFEITNEILGSNSSMLPGILRYNIPYRMDFIGKTEEYE